MVIRHGIRESFTSPGLFHFFGFVFSAEFPGEQRSDGFPIASCVCAGRSSVDLCEVCAPKGVLLLRCIRHEST